jgi:hypothetical protein
MYRLRLPGDGIFVSDVYTMGKSLPEGSRKRRVNVSKNIVQ